MKLEQLFLIDMSEAHKWNPIPVDCPAIIGRDARAEIVVPHESVSPQHLRIVCDNDLFMCEDMGSPDGTNLNNSRVSREMLQEGDILGIGEVNFIVKIITDSLPRLYFPNEKRTVALAMVPFVLGRSSQNQCVLAESSVSSQHAKIYLQGSEYFIQDCKSTNGTRINGLRIRTSRLRSGDRVQFGKIEAFFLEEFMEQGDYSLRFLSGDMSGNLFPVAPKITLGRTENNDLVIPDPVISDHHAVLYWEQGHFWLKDLGSDNGTRVSGVRIQQIPLLHGDEFALANHSFLFYHNERPAERFYLVFRGGERGGEEIVLEQFPFKIGRHTSSHLRLRDHEVSLHHAEILSQEKSFLARDCGSTNGTFVNGEKIESATIQHGDEVRIGSQYFVFRCSTMPRPELLQEDFVLLPLLAKGYGKPVLLGPKCTIGRTPENDVPLNSSHISRQHCLIVNERGHYHIRDLKSRMGTWVNEERVMQCKLQHGDEIRVGKYRFIFKNSLQPLGKGMVFGIPYWLYAVAAAAVLLLVLALSALMATSGSNTTEDKAPQAERHEDISKSDEQILSECMKNVRELQKEYRYRQAIQVMRDCHPQISTANQQYLKDEERHIQKYLDCFAEIIGQIEASLAGGKEITIDIEGRGKCLAVKAGEDVLSLREDRPNGMKFSVPWSRLFPSQVFSVVDQSGLGEEKPQQLAEFARIHGTGEIEAVYLVKAFEQSLSEVQRQNIVQRYAEILKIALTEEMDIHDGKLIPRSAKEKLLAEKEQKKRERQERLEIELAKRKQEQDTQLSQQREREEFPVRLAMAVDFTRTYGYIKAIEELEAYQKELFHQDLRAKVNEKIREIQPMANLFRRMIDGINNRLLGDYEVQFGGVKGDVIKADKERFVVKVGQGTLKSPWYSLPPEDMYQFFNKLALNPEEIYLVGVFCFDNNLLNEGNSCFIRFINRVPGEKSRVDEYLAQKLGIPVPEGGFTPYQGKLVTKDESEKRRQGYVKYKGEWVSADTREKLEQGLVLFDGQWITPDDKKMLGKKYVKYDGKWYTPQQLQELRKNWEHAWTLATAHYDLRSNVSEEFIQELGLFMEHAYMEYEKFFGKKVERRMNIYACRTYDDYRDYCMKNGYSGQLNAGGFAASKDNLGIGWLRESTAELLSVMIHEGAHLYQYNACPRCQAPSWFMESIATQFEGFQWDGKKRDLNMTFLSPRLSWLQRELNGKTYFAIPDLMEGKAMEYINNDPQKAATFYAECWGLWYFMERSPDYKARFKAYRQDVLEGKYNGRESQVFLDEFAKDVDDIEDKWHKTILKLDAGKAKLQVKGF